MSEVCWTELLGTLQGYDSSVILSVVLAFLLEYSVILSPFVLGSILMCEVLTCICEYTRLFSWSGNIYRCQIYLGVPFFSWSGNNR